MSKLNYDLIIIGGGAAGMMAAISAKRHHPNYSVAIVDRTFALGRKILVCGAGRCNITNLNLDSKIDTAYYGADNEFIHSIFDQFGFKNITSFFSDLGVDLYVERKTNIGKLFPITNQAATITEVLIDEIKRLKIVVLLEHEVKSISKTGNYFEIDIDVIDRKGAKLNSKTLIAEKLILSAGGKSYPALGSNGSGYNLAKSLDHTIIQPVPAALPLEMESNQWCHLLQGQKMEIEVTSIVNNEEIKTTSDDVMFKKYGLSGPAVLNVSREISIHFNRENKNNAYLKLNFFPGKNTSEARKFLEKRWSKRPDQSLEKSFYGIFPNKIAKAICTILKLDNTKPVSNLTEEEKDLLFLNLTELKLNVKSTRGWNEAEFTAGGIKSKEITKSTLKSKKADNLYLCGEIIDVDGDVGGFNLSWSWSSGFIAGKLL